MMNKRGISPLIATVLLIALAIALGIAVMNFGRAQIEIAAQCAVDIDMQIVELNNKPQVCFDRPTSQLFFIIENGKQIPIERIHLRIIGEKGILNQEMPDSRIAKLETLLKYVPYDVARNGEVRQVRITPEIRLYQEDIVCTEQSILMENVRDCEK